MTLTELRSYFEEQERLLEGASLRSQDHPVLKQFIADCQDAKIPFYLWNLTEQEHNMIAIERDNQCCFNHAIGMPVKAGKVHPLYDYQRKIYDTLFSNTKEIRDEEKQYPNKRKHLYLLKSSAIGASELMLRIIAYHCIMDNSLAGSFMLIITGPRLELSINLISRLKALVSQSEVLHKRYGMQPVFDSKETICYINGVTIAAMPSNHLDASRGLPAVSFILLDEAAFFRSDQQELARGIVERYWAKSDPYTVILSTPNLPNDLMHQILKLNESECPYHRLIMPYTVAYNKLLSKEDIDQVRNNSPSFEREYNCKFTGSIGSLTTQAVIDAIAARGLETYDPDTIQFNADDIPRYMDIDIGYGSSSNSAITIVERTYDDKIQVVYSQELSRYQLSDLVGVVSGLAAKYKPYNIYVDAANPEFIRALKLASPISEDANYEQQIARYKQRLSYQRAAKVNKIEADLSIREEMIVVPVNFSTTHKYMLSHMRGLLEHSPGLVSIHPRYFENLITALRGAVVEENVLIKSESPYPDTIDSFRLSLLSFSLYS